MMPMVIPMREDSSTCRRIIPMALPASGEPELRMYSFAYRTYNPMSMRWMTVDPVKDGTNWYLYVSGDPLGLCGEYFDESGYTELNIGDSILLLYPDGLTKSIEIDITITYIHDSTKGEEFVLELYKRQKGSDNERGVAIFVLGLLTKKRVVTAIGLIYLVTNIASDSPVYVTGDIIIDTSEKEIIFTGKPSARPAVKKERHIEIISRFGTVKYDKQYSNQYH